MIYIHFMTWKASWHVNWRTLCMQGSGNQRDMVAGMPCASADSINAFSTALVSCQPSKSQIHQNTHVHIHVHDTWTSTRILALMLTFTHNLFPVIMWIPNPGSQKGDDVKIICTQTWNVCLFNICLRDVAVAGTSVHQGSDWEKAFLHSQFAVGHTKWLRPTSNCECRKAFSQSEPWWTLVPATAASRKQMLNKQTFQQDSTQCWLYLIWTDPLKSFAMTPRSPWL